MTSTVAWALLASAPPHVPDAPIELVFGSGFESETLEPGAVGSGPGVDARVIAHWDVVQDRDASGDFGVGVVAFHRNGIDRVEMSVDGGPWARVEERSYHPRTGVAEHWAVLPCDELPEPRRVEVRAVAYPAVGEPRLLPSLFLNAFPGGVTGPDPLWCAPDGDDHAGDGSEASPYRTIGRAAARFTQLHGESDGAVVLCRAGAYELDGAPVGSVVTNERFLTVRPAPGLAPGSVRIVDSASPGLDTKLLRLEGITIRDLLFGASDHDDARALWADGCHFQGAGQHTSVHAVGWLYGFTRTSFTNTSISDNQLALGGGSLVRGCTIERIGEDVFRGGVLCVLNTTVHDVQAGSTGWHADLIQGNGPISNRIYYGLRCTDINAQGFYVKGNDHARKDEIALVNVLIENVGGHKSQLDGVRVDHLLLWHCTFEQTLTFRSDALSNLSVRGSSFLDLSGSAPSFAAGVGAPRLADLEDAGDWSHNHFDSGSSWVVGEPFTAGNPKFADEGADDYTPAPGSPLAGKLAPLVPFDLAGAPRPNPASVGAYE